MIAVISFGYLHGPPPEAHAVFDVRTHFRDPHVNPALRSLTAEDPEIKAAVMNTPGGTSPDGGGRRYRPRVSRRSAVIAGQAARLLRSGGIPVTVTHRDIRLPVVTR